MMASPLADNLSRSAASVAANLSQKLRCLRARPPTLASANTYRAIGQAINVVIFVERTGEGRKIKEVIKVKGRNGEDYELEDLQQSAVEAA
jgi:Flp pilus assembly CpaF family ATPase